MNAIDVKCPTCARDRDVPCIKLARVPGDRVVWTASEAHPSRVAKTRG